MSEYQSCDANQLQTIKLLVLNSSSWTLLHGLFVYSELVTDRIKVDDLLQLQRATTCGGGNVS